MVCVDVGLEVDSPNSINVAIEGVGEIVVHVTCPWKSSICSLCSKPGQDDKHCDNFYKVCRPITKLVFIDKVNYTQKQSLAGAEKEEPPATVPSSTRTQDTMKKPTISPIMEQTIVEENSSPLLGALKKGKSVGKGILQ